MNREELNWLLETIQDAKIAERFVLAQYERGRISSQAMADVARERGWITHTANQFLAIATCHSTEYATTELPIAIVRCRGYRCGSISIALPDRISMQRGY